MNVVVEITYTLSCKMTNFSFYEFLVVTDDISANDLFQASAFSKGYNGKRALLVQTIIQFVAK